MDAGLGPTARGCGKVLALTGLLVVGLLLVGIVGLGVLLRDVDLDFDLALGDDCRESDDPLIWNAPTQS